MKLLLLLFLATCAYAGDGFLFLSRPEAARIQAAVKAGESWTSQPCGELRREAKSWMKQGPWSVTSDRPKNLSLDPHEYYSEATYYWPDPANPSGKYIRHDGKTYPGRFMGNKNAMGAMSEAVFALGAAAWLFDDAAAGDRAAGFLRVFFLDPQTRMNPNLDHGQAIPRTNTGRGAGIIDSRSLIRCVQGAQFLEAAGKWSGEDREGLRRWFRQYTDWLNNSKIGKSEKEARNNHGSWWAAQVAAYAIYAGDEQGQKTAWERYRTLVTKEIMPDGSAPLEEARTKSLGYSLFNVEAHANLCRMAQMQGLDLWHVPGYQTAVDFLVPYLVNPKAWTKPQIAPLENDRAYWLAFAGYGLKKPEYVKTYQRLERPSGSWLALVDLMVGAAR